MIARQIDGCWSVWAIKMFVTMLFATGDNSCTSANDGNCGVSTGVCDGGTDAFDCRRKFAAITHMWILDSYISILHFVNQ